MLTQEATMRSMALQFAASFTNKNADAIGKLLADDFSLYDPALKWIRGKTAVVQVLKKQFGETQKVRYEVIHSFQDRNTTILEFKITLDDVILNGVDFIEWKNNKMVELRCYYNPPE